MLLNFWTPEDNFSSTISEGLANVYKKYHSKGFEIFNVALTDNEKLWLTSQHNLSIPGIHVIDKDPKSVNAAVYNVKTIPASFLIDKKGNIVARDLFGDNLRDKLKELFRQ